MTGLTICAWAHPCCIWLTPISHRLDGCCPERFSDLEVRVGNTAASSDLAPSATGNSICDNLGRLATEPEKHPATNFVADCQGELIGRYLTIERKVNGAYTIAELYVQQDRAVLAGSQMQGTVFVS